MYSETPQSANPMVKKNKEKSLANDCPTHTDSLWFNYTPCKKDMSRR